MRSRSTWLALAVGGIVTGSAWLAQQAWPPHELARSAINGFDRWIQADADKAATAAPALAESPAQLTPDRLRELLARQGIFDGPQADGSWCDNGTQLRPSVALRNRFDHYLMALELASEQEVRALVADDAQRHVGATLALGIMAIWDRYAQWRHHDFSHPFKQNEPSTWPAHLDELQRVRRQLLGPVWAEAFFAQENAAFKQYLAQLGSPMANAGRTLTHAHAERLEPAEPSDWARRLAESQAEWARLQGVRSLSPEQRLQAIHQHLQLNFQGDEALRAQALLDLP